MPLWRNSLPPEQEWVHWVQLAQSPTSQSSGHLSSLHTLYISWTPHAAPCALGCVTYVRLRYLLPELQLLSQVLQVVQSPCTQSIGQVPASHGYSLVTLPHGTPPHSAARTITLASV